MSFDLENMSFRRIKKIMIITLSIIAVLALAFYLFLFYAPFGTPPANARLERIKLSPNYKDGAFQNRLPTPMMADDASYFDLMKK